MAYDTVEAIRSWPVNSDGWHVEPITNRRIRLGLEVKIGDEVKLGNGVMLGNEVKLGYRVKLGNWVILGLEVNLGFGVNLPSVNIAGYIANPYAPGIIRIGCEIHTVKEWQRTAAAIAALHKIEAEQVPAMLAQLNWLAGWFEACPDAMTMTNTNRKGA